MEQAFRTRIVHVPGLGPGYRLTMLSMVAMILAGCQFLKPPSVTPVKVLDYPLPIVGPYRIIEGRYLLGYNYDSGMLEVFDLVDPLEPRQVMVWQWGEYDPGPYCRVRFDADLAYRRCRIKDDYHLSVVNLSDIYQPRLLYDEKGPYEFDEFTVQDGRMYTVHNDDFRSTFSVWDVSDLEHIRRLGDLQISTRSAAGDGAFEHILVHKGHAIFESNVKATLVNNKFTYFVVLYVVDITDPLHPQMVTEYDGETWKTWGGYSALSMVGDYLYAGQYSVGLRIVDFSDPKEPRTIGVLNDNNPIIRNLTVADEIVYMVGPFRFRIADVSNPRRPRLVARTDMRAYDVAVINGYVYILEGVLSDETWIFKAWER